MGLEISPLTPTAGTDFNNLTGFSVPADLPTPTAKKGEAAVTVAPLPAFLATPEATTQAAATETPAATVNTATDSAEPIKIEFGTNGGFSEVATPVAKTTPAATSSGATTVSDSARSAAKSTLASIDAKLAANGYSKTIGNQRERTDAVNAVIKNLSGDAKTKFLNELKPLAEELGLNFGRPELDGGKAAFDKLSPEKQAINRELYEEWKTGKSATPTPAAAEKTASTTKPAEKKVAPEAAAIDQQPRSGQFTDRLNDLKTHDEAYAIAWAKTLLPERGSRVTSSSVAGSPSAGVWLASEPEVAASLKSKPTAEEFGRRMKQVADQQ